jgi:type IV pilus assembly protein PilC
MATSNITLSDSEKIGLLSNLSTMLTAGIPILDAVASVLEDTKGNQKKVLETLRADLQQGKHVYASLSVFPRCFDKVTINLIKASEEAGTLETTLKDLRDHIQKDIEFADKIKFALIYPGLILIMFIMMMLVILIFVIPKISTVFSRLKVDIPLPTRIMIFVSDLMLKQTVWFVGGFVLIVGLFVLIYKKQRSLILDFFSSFPIISDLVKGVDLTRFSRSLYLLLSSGLPITTALELSQDVISKKATFLLIKKSREMVMSGKKLSEGLRSKKGVIPTIVIKLIEAGERSGTLDKSMQDISTYLDYEVSNTLKTFAAVIEPVMLLLVAVGVGGMMMAIIAPIYGLISQVGGH